MLLQNLLRATERGHAAIVAAIAEQGRGQSGAAGPGGGADGPQVDPRKTTAGNGKRGTDSRNPVMSWLRKQVNKLPLDNADKKKLRGAVNRFGKSRIGRGLGKFAKSKGVKGFTRIAGKVIGGGGLSNADITSLYNSPQPTTAYHPQTCVSAVYCLATNSASALSLHLASVTLLPWPARSILTNSTIAP